MKKINSISKIFVENFLFVLVYGILPLKVSERGLNECITDLRLLNPEENLLENDFIFS